MGIPTNTKRKEEKHSLNILGSEENEKLSELGLFLRPPRKSLLLEIEVIERDEIFLFYSIRIIESSYF